MKLSLITTVTKVESKQEYPRKPNGSVDWSGKQEEVIYSTITILDNPQRITGILTVPQLLIFGGLYEIFFNDQPTAQAVEIQQVEAEYLPLDAEKP